jgi:hypothetical protein
MRPLMIMVVLALTTNHGRADECAEAKKKETAAGAACTAGYNSCAPDPNDPRHEVRCSVSEQREAARLCRDAAKASLNRQEKCKQSS